MRAQRTLILCVGSRLMGDDAVGLIVGEILLEREMPAEVRIFESGSNVFALLDEIMEFDEVVIIDSIKSGLVPGEVAVIDLRNLIQGSMDEIQSLHDIDVVSAIKLGYELFGEKMPRRIFLIGVGVRDISPGIKLSVEVEKAIPKIMEEVSRFLKRDPSNFSQPS